jgi:hypothetical protein
MSIFEDSQTLLYVCTITNGLADNAAYTDATHPAGSGVFVNLDNMTVEEAALTAATNYRFYYKNAAGVLQMSPRFTTATLKNAFAVENEARVEQVTYLGYNGTSGSMDATNNTYYGLQLILNHTFGMLNNSPLILTIPYKSDATATQYEVANGLAAAARAALKRHNACISVTLINDGAQANALAACTVSVVNGGKQIVTSDDETALILAGTLLRFGTSGAGTAAVYKVVSHDSGAGAARIYTLDRPYEGATAAAYAAATFESVTEGNYGLRFVGVSVTDANFTPQTDEPFVVSFELGVRDFTTATVTYTTKPVIGSGTNQQIRALEAYGLFQNRDRVISAYPVSPNYTYQTVLSESYHVFSFEIWDEKFVDATTGLNPKSPTRIVIALDKDLDEAFQTVLAASVTSTLI